MKAIRQNLLAFVLVAIAAGCAFAPVATRNVSYSAALSQGDVIEVAIDAAREAKFPAATKIDKQNGSVEFGNYQMSELGTTALIRVKSPTEIEINIKRGSVYVPLGADKGADQFRSIFEAKLREAEHTVRK